MQMPVVRSISEKRPSCPFYDSTNNLTKRAQLQTFILVNLYPKHDSVYQRKYLKVTPKTNMTSFEIVCFNIKMVKRRFRLWAIIEGWGSQYCRAEI